MANSVIPSTNRNILRLDLTYREPKAISKPNTNVNNSQNNAFRRTEMQQELIQQNVPKQQQFDRK